MHDLEIDKVVFFIILYARLLWPYIKIPKYLVSMMENYGGAGMHSKY